MNLKLQARKKDLFGLKYSVKGQTSSEEVATDPFSDDGNTQKTTKSPKNMAKVPDEKSLETYDYALMNHLQNQNNSAQDDYFTQRSNNQASKIVPAGIGTAKMNQVVHSPKPASFEIGNQEYKRSPVNNNNTITPAIEDKDPDVIDF